MHIKKYTPQYLAVVTGGLLTALVLGVGALHTVSMDSGSLKAAVEAQKPDASDPPPCSDGSCIPLLAPLGKMQTIPISTSSSSEGVSGAIGTFLTYFQDAFSLFEAIAVGFSVLWILIGGFYIMMSGSDGGMRGTGKSIILWAVVGLVLTEFAGFFLKTLNSVFFK